MVVINGQSQNLPMYQALRNGGHRPPRRQHSQQEGGGGLSHPVTGSTGAFNRIEPSFPGASSMSAATTPAEHTPELLHCPCIPNHGR